MELELLKTSLRSSLFTFITIGVLSHIVYLVLFLLKPYFIRGVKKINLKYTQDIYFTGYIFLKKLTGFLAISAYIAVFIFRLSTGGVFNTSYVWFYIGVLLLIAYTISEIFIDYNSNTTYLYTKIGVNIISLITILITYISVISLFN